MSNRGLAAEPARRVAAPSWRAMIQDACWFLASCPPEVATAVTVIVPLDSDPPETADTPRQVRSLVSEFGLTARVEIAEEILTVCLRR